MGNIVMTVNWPPTTDDDDIKKELKKIALMYRVETEVHHNVSNWVKDYSRYAVELSGFNISWNGGHAKCKHIMEMLSEKWTEILNEKNISDFKITIDHLPM